MWDPNKPRESINEIKLLNFIQAFPDQEIFVRKACQHENFPLVVNFQGQLCYQDGLSKRLFPAGGNGFEVCELSIELMDRMESGKSKDSDNNFAPTQKSTMKMESTPANTTMDIYAFIRGFNNFVEKTACPDPEPLPPKTVEKTYISERTTHFKVTVPPYYQLPDLVVRYVLAITKSLDELRNALQDTNCRVGTYRTKGLVKNIFQLYDLIKKDLEAANISCKIVPTNGAYSHLFAWIKPEDDQFGD